MPYFPAILSDPELGISKKDQNLILGAASSAWLKNKGNIVLYVLALFIWATTIALTKLLLNRIGPISSIYTTLLWVGTFVTFILGSHYLIFHIRFKPYLFKALRDEGHDICLKCGYILFTLPDSETKCPECGTTRSALDFGCSTSSTESQQTS